MQFIISWINVWPFTNRSFGYLAVDFSRSSVLLSYWQRSAVPRTTAWSLWPQTAKCPKASQHLGRRYSKRHFIAGLAVRLRSYLYHLWLTRSYQISSDFPQASRIFVHVRALAEVTGRSDEPESFATENWHRKR